MSRQHRRTWQRHESAVAAALGTTRTGASAQSGRDGGADVRTEWLVAECKSWRQLPARVLAALEQAERSATPEQLPVAVLHGVGQRHEHDLVVLRWRDFLEWFGAGTSENAPQSAPAAQTPLKEPSPTPTVILCSCGPLCDTKSATEVQNSPTNR